MDSARFFVLLWLFFFIFYLPRSPRLSPGQRLELDRRRGERAHGASVLVNSSYGDFAPDGRRWLNLTGFREEDGFAWDRLATVKHKVLEDTKNVLGSKGLHLLRRDEVQPGDNAVGKEDFPFSLYKNVTSRIHGEWTRSSLEKGLSLPSSTHLWNPSNQTSLNETTPDTFRFANYRVDRNITGTSGKISVRLNEKQVDQVLWNHTSAQDISAVMKIYDTSSPGDGWDVDLYGVHFVDYGGLLLTSSGSRYAGRYGLPHLALSERDFHLTQRLLNKTLASSSGNRRSRSGQSPENESQSSDSSDYPFSLSPVVRCEYVVYLQQYPLARSAIHSKDPAQASLTSETLDLIEEELRFPTGASLPKAPHLTMSMLAFSPNCGIILESKGPPNFSAAEGLHLRGAKLESYLSNANGVAALYALVLAAQMILLKRQMTAAGTPSTMSRISLNSVGMMAFGDGFAWAVLLVLGIFIDAVYLVMLPASFFAFMCVSFLGMKFLIDLWVVQAPERRERERAQERQREERQAAATTNASSADNPGGSRPANAPAVVVTPAGADVLPPPASARPADNSGATPVVLPPDQDLDAAAQDDETAAGTERRVANNQPPDPRREFSVLYTRFYFMLLGLILLSIHAISWPSAVRSAYTNMLALIYFSFWIPQIHRNIMRNCRKALNWEYAIGQSLLRLVPFCYLYFVPSNVFFIDIDPIAAYVLLGWVWLQLWVLGSQELLGPRFFVPDGWAPPAYDYHPVLREADLEAGGGTSMPRASARAPSPSQESLPSKSDTLLGTGSSTSQHEEAASVRGPGAERPKRTFTCGVCLQDLEISGDEGVLERRSYMLTPCGHIYHADCLKAWADIRLICPLCKEDLPPY